MRRSLLLALVGCLVWVSAAAADVPLPSDKKYVTPKVSFEGVDKQADYVFFLKYNAGNGNPFAAAPTVIEVKNAEPFDMAGGRRIAAVQLFAVPKADAAKLRETNPKEWGTDKTPGVLKADVTAPNTVVSSKLKEVPVTTYRVSVADGKMKVEMLAAENKRGEAPADRLPRVAAASAAALSLALFGIWFARRRSGGLA
jgi:hypothetical protein